MPEIHEINWKPVIKRWKKDGRKMGTFIRVTRDEEESAYKVVLRHLAKRTETFLYKSLKSIWEVHFGAGRVVFGKKSSPGPGFFQDVTMEPGFFQVENTRRLRVFSERIATLGRGR